MPAWLGRAPGLRTRLPEPLKRELHADAAAALCCLVDARKDLVGAAIAASWILAMHLQALVLAVGTLRHGVLQREDAVGRRAADAAYHLQRRDATRRQAWRCQG